jgi:hypothetical protein
MGKMQKASTPVPNVPNTGTLSAKNAKNAPNVRVFGTLGAL